GIALAARAAAELVVDPARLVALGAHDVQAAVADHPLVLGSVTRRASASAEARASAGAVAGSRPRLRRISLDRKSALPPSRMSVPRPAMLVAIVTAPSRPAWATISASRSWYLALSTSWRTPRFLRSLESTSDFSIDTVPTSTGWPPSWHLMMSSTTALNFSRSVLYTTSGLLIRMRVRFVGTTVTSSL